MAAQKHEVGRTVGTYLRQAQPLIACRRTTIPLDSIVSIEIAIQITLLHFSFTLQQLVRALRLVRNRPSNVLTVEF